MRSEGSVELRVWYCRCCCGIQTTRTHEKPSALPNEEDVQKVREYTLSAISNMLADSYMSWTGHEFGRLRDLIVCRLTLFNARRGGEPARMLLTQFQAAQNDQWIDKQLAVKITDPLQSALLGKFHIAYMSGKGARYMVPILVQMI